MSKMDDDRIYVISDVRYKSEMKALKDKFGSNVTSVRVERFDSCDSTDPSERDLDDYEFDRVLSNRGSLIALYGAASTLFT